jgi:hypothetical protein
MSSVPGPWFGQGPCHVATTTYVYDGSGSYSAERAGMPPGGSDGAGMGSGAANAEPGEPRSPGTPARPPLHRALEFRLTGSEARSMPLGPGAPADLILAVERVRVDVTRAGAAAADGALGGVEIQAELREGVPVCTAQVSDFAAGDLVVVQVDVALYERG